MEKQQGTSIVTVKDLLTIYKGEEKGTNIQLCQLEENDFEIVVMKSLYNSGDKVVMISPDYCLPNTNLFDSYTNPEVGKSKLGGGNRVRAVKFNFTKEDGSKVFSNGILLPLQEVKDYLTSTGALLQHQSVQDIEDHLDKYLDITKMIDDVVDNDSVGKLPSGIYKTDETNINNQKRNIEKLFVEPVTMIASLKLDGSSNSIFYKPTYKVIGQYEEVYPQEGVCSRSLEKKMYTESYTGLRESTRDYEELEVGQKVERKGGKPFKSGLLQNTVKSVTELEVTFEEDDSVLHRRSLGQSGYLTEYNEFFTEEDAKKLFTKEKVLSNNPHVVLSQPILEALRVYNKPLVVRSEIFGGKLKGSGNSNNPNRNDPPSIRIYGVDDYSTGVAKPLPMSEVERILEEMNLTHLLVPIVYKGVINDYQQLKQITEDYFKDNLVEGLVWRTYNDASFSAKSMNLTYDSLK